MRFLKAAGRKLIHPAFLAEIMMLAVMLVLSKMGFFGNAAAGEPTNWVRFSVFSFALGAIYLLGRMAGRLKERNKADKIGAGLANLMQTIREGSSDRTKIKVAVREADAPDAKFIPHDEAMAQVRASIKAAAPTGASK